MNEVEGMKWLSAWLILNFVRSVRIIDHRREPTKSAIRLESLEQGRMKLEKDPAPALSWALSKLRAPF